MLITRMPQRIYTLYGALRIIEQLHYRKQLYVYRKGKRHF